MKKKTLDLNILSKVRGLPGFPKAEDSDIISLSDPPHYTACPNPFLEEFVKENSTPYDPKKDQYQKQSFASDVSEDKHDLVYNIHTYHTKVPPKAIVWCILHYTKPGDLIYDGFCGTGMTGVAAQISNNPDPEFKKTVESFASVCCPPPPALPCPPTSGPSPSPCPPTSGGIQPQPQSLGPSHQASALTP